jgi:hypothetical protein
MDERGNGGGPLAGIAMSELAGIGPAPPCSAQQAGMGAEYRSQQCEDDIIDGRAPFWRCYETRGGGFVWVRMVDARFHDLSRRKLEIAAMRAAKAAGRQA